MEERLSGAGGDLAAHVHSGVATVTLNRPQALNALTFGMLETLRDWLDHWENDAGVRMVVLDSLNGYVNAMPQEDFLHLHLHELLGYLNQRGVVTIMVLAQHGLIGAMGTPVDVSYLADTVFLMRFFEARGALKKAVSVVKKRSGFHEQTIRGFTMGKDGIVVGEPLLEFQGVMTGVPQFVGDPPTRQARDPGATP